MSTALARRNPNGDAILGIIYMQMASSVQDIRTIGHFQKYQWLIRVGLKPWILKRELFFQTNQAKLPDLKHNCTKDK